MLAAHQETPQVEVEEALFAAGSEYDDEDNYYDSGQELVVDAELVIDDADDIFYSDEIDDFEDDDSSRSYFFEDFVIQ